MLRVLPRAVMVHLDRGRSRTLSLVCDLNLTFADLDGRCVSRTAVLSRSALFLVRDLRQPLARAVLLLMMSLSHTHCIALGEYTLRPVQVPAGYGHR